MTFGAVVLLVDVGLFLWLLHYLVSSIREESGQEVNGEGERMDEREARIQELQKRQYEAQTNAVPNVNQEMAGSCAPARAERVTLENIDDVMRYQPWNYDQVQAGDIVREALTAAAKAILRNVPESPMRTKALGHIIDARMDANAAISFRGRF